MKILIGEGKRVFDFFAEIGKSKVALISHIDLDGIASAKVVNKIVKPDFIKFVEYEELNLDLAKELKQKK